MVSVGRIKGSAPRETGARMLITADACDGTIGGGNLEFTATHRARALLAAAPDRPESIETYGLGPDMNQCCGGAVTLRYERFSASAPDWLQRLAAEPQRPAVLISAPNAGKPEKTLIRSQGDLQTLRYPALQQTAAWQLERLSAAAGTAVPEIDWVDIDGLEYWIESFRYDPPRLFLFGAGHVGRATAPILNTLPFETCWIDSRPEMFPAADYPHVNAVVSAEPLSLIADAPPDAYYLVMTHSHELDEELCHAVLQKGNFRWLGLIGSNSKRRRFVSRLRKRGIDDALVERLTCPIGLAGIGGKQPATIALSVCAQLVQLLQSPNDIQRDAEQQ